VPQLQQASSLEQLGEALCAHRVGLGRGAVVLRERQQYGALVALRVSAHVQCPRDGRYRNTFGAKLEDQERRLVRRLLPLESAGLSIGEARRVADRIMAAKFFVLTAALGAEMSEVMRSALAEALLESRHGLSEPLRFRFLSKALALAPGREIEAFEKRARQLFKPLPAILKLASTLPSTPRLVAAAKSACETFEPWDPPVPLGNPSDWVVLVLLAREGNRAAADAMRALVRIQDEAAERSGDASVRCAPAVRRIARSAATPAFDALARELAPEIGDGSATRSIPRASRGRG